MENIKAAQREVERQAFNEFVDLSMAVKQFFTLDLVIRPEAGFDSVRQGRFMAGLVGLYQDKLDARWPEFLTTELFTEEDNRGLTLKSYDRGSLISVARTFQEYAQGTGFTIGL